MTSPTAAMSTEEVVATAGRILDEIEHAVVGKERARLLEREAVRVQLLDHRASA